MGMVERRDGTGLTLEAVGEALVGHLYGNDAIQSGIAGFVNDAHTSRADRLENFVVAKFSARRERHDRQTSVSPAIVASLRLA